MKNIYPLLLTVLTVQLSFGQVEFNNKVITESLIGLVTDMQVSDLDGDGDLDVLVSSRGNEKVSWFENIDNNGDFEQREIVNNIDGAESVYADDIDNDGDMDVVIASSGMISWCENVDGTGSFSTPNIISTEVSSFSKNVYVSDLDGDGDNDVIFSEAVNNKLEWHENIDGLGNFGEQQVLDVGAGSVSEFYVKDVDGDGDNDIVYGKDTGSITLGWLENEDGLGDFGENHPLFFNIQVTTLYVEDVDGDSDLDVVARVFNTVSWFENTDGQGTFSSEKFVASSLPMRSIYVADIDGDNDNDIVSSVANSDDKIVWYENLDGMGNYGGEQIITTAIADVKVVQVADINGDGDNDVVSASVGDDKIAFYLNTDGLGNFGNQQIITYSEVRRPNSIFSVDIDSDGDNDVLFAATREIGWYENTDGQGNFGNPIIIASNGFFDYITSGDLDGDGDNDVICASGNIDNSIMWFENTDGLGTFSDAQFIAQNVQIGLVSILIIDIDNDGDKDVLFSSVVENKIVWYPNIDGQGTFGSELVISNSIDGPRCVYANDIDGDGDMDVLSASIFDSKIAWYENMDGQGNFGEQQVISTEAQQVVSIYADDIDGDGDIDVMSASNTDDKIAWYENMDGQGNFGAQNIISTLADRAYSVYAEDLDNDGDMDVLSASKWDNKIAWYENIDGQGGFGDQQVISNTSYSAEMVYAIDIDGDLDIDVLSVSTADDKIAWYENLGLNSNAISGKVSFDVDSNDCTSGEVPFENVMLITTDGINSFSTFTNANGFYKLYPDAGDYETSVSFQTSNITVTPTVYNSDFIGTGNIDTANFCVSSVNAVNDLNITIYPSIDDPRPGFDTTYQLVYGNTGTTQLSGEVTFEFDNAKMQFLTGSETVTSQTSNTLTFSYSNLNPFETRTIDLLFNVFAPPTTNIDDVLVSTATITPVSGDETEEDNTFELEQIVIGSYDPNDIRVLEGDEVLIDDINKYLHYIIRFQNTGTASAINVRVEHVLDDKLDWTTMQLQSMSHSGRVEIINGSEVSFIFDNINLPDSTNDEPNSHGFIAFKVKPEASVVVGDVINGVADIYFDFNPPIITNTVSTEIVAPLSVAEDTLQNFSLYPNPVENEMMVTSKTTIDGITIYDINGRLLTTATYVHPKTAVQLDVKSLSEGLYFLEVRSEDIKQTMKFLKR